MGASVRPVSMAVEVMKFVGYCTQQRLVGTLVASNCSTTFLMGARSFRLRFGLVDDCLVTQVLLIATVGLMDQGTWFRQMKIFKLFSQGRQDLNFSSRYELLLSMRLKAKDLHGLSSPITTMSTISKRRLNLKSELFSIAIFQFPDLIDLLLWPDFLAPIFHLQQNNGQIL